MLINIHLRIKENPKINTKLIITNKVCIAAPPPFSCSSQHFTRSPVGLQYCYYYCPKWIWKSGKCLLPIWEPWSWYEDPNFHPSKNSSFWWYFDLNLWHTRHYFCRFRSGKKDVSMDVYSYEKEICRKDAVVCFYKIQKDGIYEDSARGQEPRLVKKWWSNLPLILSTWSQLKINIRATRVADDVCILISLF